MTKLIMVQLTIFKYFMTKPTMAKLEMVQLTNE
jgi:hypothetical protein